MPQIDTKTYLLGHTESELERLGTQAAVIDPMFRNTLLEAGISQGMRVLDVASGPGYVATMLAEMVGPDGEVVGTDISEDALATARLRTEQLGLKNLSFMSGDPSKMDFDQPFDAVVGRYILMFLPDPTAMVRGVARHLRPGGVIAFHEVSWDGVRAVPPAPIYATCSNWLTETAKKMNVDPEMAMKFGDCFRAAGLPAPNLRIEALIGTSETSWKAVKLLCDLTRTMMPSVIETGTASAEEIDIDTLSDRMYTEIISNRSTVVMRSEIGAWAHLPG